MRAGSLFAWTVLPLFAVACNIYNNALFDDSGEVDSGVGGLTGQGGSTGFDSSVGGAVTGGGGSGSGSTGTGSTSSGGSANTGGAFGGTGGESDAGTGGDPSTGGSGTTGGTGGETGGTGGTSTGGNANTEILDDFEDCDRQLSPTAGRDGLWTATPDSPAGGAPSFIPDEVSEWACGQAVNDSESHSGSFALHVVSTDALGSSGAVLEANFKSDNGIYDGSAYVGIRFWLKVDVASNPLRVNVIEPRTVDDEVCTDVEGNGNACFDHFGKNFAVSGNEWKQYEILFADLKTKGQQPGSSWLNDNSSLDTTKLYRFQIAWGQNAQPDEIDFWIDDVEFIVK